MILYAYVLCCYTAIFRWPFLFSSIEATLIDEQQWFPDRTDDPGPWRSFFQAAVVSILLYGCTTWTLTKRLEKKLDGNYTRMLRAILNKYWRQHPTKHQLYGHLSPITKTIQVRRTRHAGHWWRSWNELISDILQWTPTYGRAKAGRLARTYIQQLCEHPECCPEDLPAAMNDREMWPERVCDIRASGTTWWWWWWWLFPSYFCSVDYCVVCIGFSRCNDFSSAFYYYYSFETIPFKKKRFPH